MEDNEKSLNAGTKWTSEISQIFQMKLSQNFTNEISVELCAEDVILHIKCLRIVHH